MHASIPLLRRDHVNFNLILNALENQVMLAENGGVVSAPLFKMAVRYFRDYPRRFHHPKEDLIYGKLLPHLNHGTESVFHVIQDHRELGEHLATLEGALRTYDPDDQMSVDRLCDAARAFVHHEREHMSREEGHLYPAAVRLITPEEWDMIETELEQEDDPTFNAEAVAALDHLIAEVLLRDGLSRGLDKL